MKRFFVLVVVLLSSLFTANSAWAYWIMSHSGETAFDTEAAGCSSFLAYYRVQNPNITGTTVQKIGTSPNSSCWVYASGNYQGGDPLIYMAGTPPPPQKCKGNEGKVGIVNWTEGFTRTPDEGDRAAVGGYNKPPSDGKMCEAGCLVSAQTSGPGVEYFVSQQPTAQGLYRRSADFPTVGLAEECTASNNAPNSPVAPEPKCTGTLGQVNNKTVCVSSPAAPVNTEPMGEPSTEPIAGNPSAGIKPASGGGSGTGSKGRTPDAGVGGNSGGSAVAAVGGKGGDAGGTSTGTGTVKTPASGEQQANCGAPGQPVCAVKVDEKDMPDGKSAFTKTDEALEKNATDSRAGIDKAAGMVAPSWSFSFQLPTGCQPYDTGIKGFVLDPCKYQSTIHDLMSMIWAAVTAFCIIGMVSRTIREA